MKVRSHRVVLWWGAALASCLFAALSRHASGAPPELAADYDKSVRPLLARFCGDCHGPELAEGEIDLISLADFAKASQQTATWQKVAEMLASGQMPPKDSRQPSDEQRQRLSQWVGDYLRQEARRTAGDPGPVVLRRLNNAQYAFVLRDLTGVESLAPASEFPVDGAAGEGFTNTGAALAMSPTLLTKYLDAAKEVSKHAVLLPDGIRFSPSTTRRDWTNETLAEIRGLYGKYSDAHGGTQVNLQGIVFETNGGGRLPLEQYLAATLEERQALAGGTKSIGAVARDRRLSAKYLGGLWKLLAENSPREQPSLLIDDLRARWRSAKPDDAEALAGDVTRWQRALWKFNSVGHIGKVGGPQVWMEKIEPVASRLDVRLKLDPPPGSDEITVYLAAGDLSDGRNHDFVLWQQPRLVAPGRPDLLLKEVRRVTAELKDRRQKLFASAAAALAAAAQARQTSARVDVAELAQRHQLEPAVLAPWLEYLGIGAGQTTRITGHFTGRVKNISGYDFVQGWSTEELPMLAANASDQHVRIPGNMLPHSVAVHPTPGLSAAVGWQSPLDGEVRVSGLVQHAHPECGNGVTWHLELRRGNTRQRLAEGISHGAKEVAVGPLDKLSVRHGDVVSLVIGPRDGNHSCDLTRIDLSLASLTDDKRWNLAGDVSSDLHAGNPHPDRLGNEGVWHFYSEPVKEAAAGSVIPAGSLLAQWQAAKDATEQQRLAAAVQRLLVDGPTAKDTPDAALYRQLASLGGPLLSAARAASARTSDERSFVEDDGESWGLDPQRFGRHGADPAASVDPGDLCVQAPEVIAVRLPADLVAGYELVTTGLLHDSGAEGSVQLHVTTAKEEAAASLRPGIPLIAAEGSAARRRLEASIAEFRQWFPAALCYEKIVPVDEVVTLTLFYREDHELARLMLSDEEAARLDRLWDELHYISHDALTLVDAFAQLMEYATQDADPKVFAPLRGPIEARAAAFRQRLVATEPRHVEAVVALAAKAFRRRLSDAEQAELRGFYQNLRDEELSHDEAIRLTLARVFVSPAFLYRAEQAQPGRKATPVSDDELASRLSFFLWSSLPDDELRRGAAAGQLHDQAVLLAQTRRMLKDPRARRLASEFACQWLQIYDFDAHDEKSPAAFPSFAELRGDMYEEAIRFFTDLVQRDGSILELLQADHVFVNEELARHYGIAGVSGDQWRRIDGANQHGRGGILALAATLSKQSGASRTSPILRGNWVCEVLLGEKLPNPPPGVPVLPETVPAGLTERELIEQHSSVESCAKCHVRIDPYGFALEGYDAIGRFRLPLTTRRVSEGSKSGSEEKKSGSGTPAIDVRATAPDGTKLDGLPGLRTYLLTKRRDDFVRQFCKKLLGYSLGRSVQLSDEPLLEEMQAKLKASDYRISVAIESIVTSPQFRMIRGRDFSEDP